MRSREELYAIYIIDNESTIRGCAKYFNISKSTVHNYISRKLRTRNKFLYFAVCKVLERNFKERHLRGGEATKQKYLRLRTTMH